MPAAIASRGERRRDRRAVEQHAPAGQRLQPEQRRARPVPARRRAGRPARPPRRHGLSAESARPSRCAARPAPAAVCRGLRRRAETPATAPARQSAEWPVQGWFAQPPARRPCGRRAAPPCGRQFRTPRRVGARRRSCRRRGRAAGAGWPNSRATSSAGRLAVGSSSTSSSASAASARLIATSDFSVRLSDCHARVRVDVGAQLSPEPAPRAAAPHSSPRGRAERG